MGHRCWSSSGKDEPKPLKDKTRAQTTHMSQFLQGGKNGRLMSFFFKVEPPCDQT